MPDNYCLALYLILNAAFTENMNWSFGLWKNEDVINNKTDGSGLLTEALCMAKKEENFIAFLLHPLLLEKLLNPPRLPQLPNTTVCFMHLQTSVTLIDTLWNSLKLHFHLKNHTSSQMHRRLNSHYGTEELQAMHKMICFTPGQVLPPLAHSLCSINE